MFLLLVETQGKEDMKLFFLRLAWYGLCWVQLWVRKRHFTSL